MSSVQQMFDMPIFSFSSSVIEDSVFCDMSSNRWVLPSDAEICHRCVVGYLDVYSCGRLADMADYYVIFILIVVVLDVVWPVVLFRWLIGLFVWAGYWQFGGDRGSTVVMVLHYKSEGRWCHGIFHWHKFFWSHYGPGVDSASNRNEYQEYFLGVNAAGS
jgi:hypothetical protein